MSMYTCRLIIHVLGLYFQYRPRAWAVITYLIGLFTLQNLMRINRVHTTVTVTSVVVNQKP